MTNKKKTKGQAIIYKAIHRKLKIEQQDEHTDPYIEEGRTIT